MQIEDGSHRQSDWLELLFDLAFVICIANLSHQLSKDFAVSDLFSYVGFLIPIWWVWNQFTWYSNHFNNGDSLFRLQMFAGIAGSLLMGTALNSHDPHHLSFVLSYIFLHSVLVLGWLRAYRHIHLFRPYIRLKLTGLLLGILFWSTSLLFHGQTQIVLWTVGLLFQLSLPVFAWATVTNLLTVHIPHLRERHGLFTIIVLGECFVSLVGRISLAENFDDWIWILVSFTTILAIWQIYFLWDKRTREIKGVSRSFTYNYGHLVIYSGLGIVAAGISLSSTKMTGLGSLLFLTALLCIELITRKNPMA